MKPIKRGLLPNTVTLYNAFNDPDTGKTDYFRTYLQFTRIMTEKNGLVSSTNEGATRELLTELWVDPVSSIAYDVISGVQIQKRYADPYAWEQLTDKIPRWTIREGDFVVKGVCAVTVPPGTAEDITDLPYYTVRTVILALDKPGNVHHWEVQLV